MNKLLLIGLCAAALCSNMPLANAQPQRPAPFKLEEPKTTTVNNPWMWSDVPDPDIIRVGDFYYLVSTTMHLMPGGPIMRSRDLVTWETVSYLFDEIHDTPRYDMTNPYQVSKEDAKEFGMGGGDEAIGTVYGRGQWATSIRYNNGTFWALFVANDAPHKSMVFKTDDPAKGWTLHSRLPAFHDASLFFDEDGRAYVFSGSGDIRLVELEPDLTDVKKGGINKTLQLSDKPMGLHEGSRVIKHDGMYYLLCIAWPNTGREEICYRSRNIEGPYESKVICKSKFGGWDFVGQGTIVDGKNGEWYGVIFQDRGGVGRVLTLSPCSWIDGWPMIGTVQEGLIPDNMTLRVEDPTPAREFSRLSHVTPSGFISIVQSDDFDETSTLNSNLPLWQWNHNPVKEAWSLKERPGYLRLKTSVKAKTLFDARNTLTQRMEGPTCQGTINLDIRKMKDGDRAGLAAINGHSGILTVEKNGNKTELVLTYEEVELSNREHAIANTKRDEIARVSIKAGKNLSLRITGDFRPGKNDNATFWYSTDDGKQWKQLGGNYQMRFDYRRMFMGTKFAIFNYCTKQPGGYIDVDNFIYEHE